MWGERFDTASNASGSFAESESVTVAQVEEAASLKSADELLFAPETALPHWPSVSLNGDMAFYLDESARDGAQSAQLWIGEAVRSG